MTTVLRTHRSVFFISVVYRFLCFITSSDTLLNSFLGNCLQRRKEDNRSTTLLTLSQVTPRYCGIDLVFLVKDIWFCLICSNIVPFLTNKLLSLLFLSFPPFCILSDGNLQNALLQSIFFPHCHELICCVFTQGGIIHLCNSCHLRALWIFKALMFGCLTSYLSSLP